MKFEKRNRKNIERTNRYTRKINQKEDLIRKSNKKSKQKNRHHKQVRENKSTNHTNRNQKPQRPLTLSATPPGRMVLTTTPVDLPPMIPKPRPEPSLIRSITST